MQTITHGHHRHALLQQSLGHFAFSALQATAVKPDDRRKAWLPLRVVDVESTLRLLVVAQRFPGTVRQVLDGRVGHLSVSRRSGETAQAKHQQQTKRANSHWQILSNRRGERAKPHPHTVAHTTQLSPQSPAFASAVVNENPSSFQPSTPPIISLTGSPS